MLVIFWGGGATDPLPTGPYMSIQYWLNSQRLSELERDNLQEFFILMAVKLYKIEKH